MSRPASPRAQLRAAAAILCLLACGTATAQSTSSSLTGTVRAAEGGAQPDAVVHARSEETGALRTGVTDAQGKYRIDLLAPGVWIVSARLAGGELSESKAVLLRLQQTMRLDFTVNGGVSERVTVTAEAPLVDAKETAGVLRVSSAQADSLPLAGRAFTDLAMLDSSVRTAAEGNYYGERGSVFVVNGQTGRSNTFLVDGLDNNDQTSGTSLNSFFSQQVIREFVLSTHQYSPEFGRASGGVLNIVTHQGSNDFKWQAFVQGSVEGWNRSGDFVDRLPDTGGPEAVRRHQTGFSLSGPFRKDKAFFFLAYERQEADDVVPYTGVDRNNVEGGRVLAPADDDNLFFRADFNIGPRHTFMFRLSFDDRTSSGINVGGVTTPEAGFAIDERDLQFASSWTSILSPNLISETRFLASTSEFDQQGNSGRPGVTRPSGIFGGNNLNRQLREEEKLQLVQNFTVRRNEHTLKFGLDVSRSATDIATAFNPNGNFTYDSDRPFEPGDCGLGVSAFAAQQSLPDGTVVDAVGNPRCIGVPGVDDDSDGIVDEGTNILTYPTFFTFIDGQPTAKLEDTLIGVFAQDSWDVGPRLLLDYGLRYDLSTYTLPGSARVDSPIPNGGASRDTDNLAPRLGFTFTPKAEGKTVLRGGGGVFYDKLVLGFPAVASITSGTEIGIFPMQGFALEFTEVELEQVGIDAVRAGLLFPEELIMRFSTATELETPYTVQFNVGVDRAVGPHGAFKTNFVRARGYHVPLMKDLNPVTGLIPPGLTCPDDIDPTIDVGIPCHATDPTTGSIAAITTEGRSWYWGLDLAYRWRRDDSWFSSSYTLSRAEDTGFDPLKGGIALPPDSTDLSLERGRSDGDRRHRLVLSGESGLPIMGLRLSGVLQFASGLPFNVTTGQDDNFDGILSDRPAGVRRNSGEETSLAVINDLRAEHNLTLPPDRQLAPVLGLDEPTFAQLDLRLSRPFAWGKGQGEFFVQIFNVFDRENGGLIEGRAIARSFGEVITLAGPPRTVELGLKLGL